MIGGTWFGQRRIFAALSPIELAAVDDQSGNRIAMATEKLRSRMYDDVGTPLDRPNEVGRGEGVIDDEWNACFSRHSGHGLDVSDDAARVGDAFDEDCLCFRRQ